MGLPRKQVKCFLNNSIKITIEQNLLNIKKSDYYRLFRYPWPFWIASLFIISVCNIYFLILYIITELEHHGFSEQILLYIGLHSFLHMFQK